MMRFLRLPIYHDVVELRGIIQEITAQLPEKHADIAEMLESHASIAGLRIARGSAPVTRDEAWRCFRYCKRSAELLHAILLRLELAGFGSPDALAEGIRLSARIVDRARIITERLQQKLPRREVFRD